LPVHKNYKFLVCLRALFLGSSRIPGFYDLPLEGRIQALQESYAGDASELDALWKAISSDQADPLIENVVGIFGMPLGIALNFLVDDREVLVPMAIEEPSVVAGASFMAKLVRAGGGFQTDVGPSEMIGQMQVLDIDDLAAAQNSLEEAKAELLQTADRSNPEIVSLGGGARDIEIRLLEQTEAGPMLVMHLIFDTLDAMGANTVNTALDSLSARVEELTRGHVHLRIISNLADRRLARASCRIPVEQLAFGDFTGEEVLEGIIQAWAFAEADPYRATTHNKGIMNGIDAVLIATGNDWRAVEAGAHSYAARTGTYTSLSTWSKPDNGFLTGKLELPMVAGTIGGATQAHPTASACLKLMGVKTAQELASVVVSVGLAQNLAALRALATEGIQKGHMRLHARQIAISAGAQGDMIQIIADRLADEGAIRQDRARELLEEMSKS
jgi:hydroxymethylglutaryl-CoA reductase